MKGTKTFTLKDRFDYLRRIGSKGKYGSLVSSFVDSYRSFFQFEFPCKVTVTLDDCGIVEMVLKSEHTTHTFKYPRFGSCSYRFDSIIENLFTINDKGLPYLKEVFNVDDSSLYFSNCCETAEGKYKKTLELSLPYVHVQYDIWIELNYPIINVTTGQLLQRYTETIEAAKTFLQERSTFSFRDLLRIVVSALGVPIEQIKKVDIPNFLLYSGGKVYMATSRTESGDFVTYSNDMKTASYITTDFRVDLSLESQVTAVNNYTGSTISEETKAEWQNAALKVIDGFMQEVNEFNKK